MMARLETFPFLMVGSSALLAAASLGAVALVALEPLAAADLEAVAGPTEMPSSLSTRSAQFQFFDAVALGAGALALALGAGALALALGAGAEAALEAALALLAETALGAGAEAAETDSVADVETVEPLVTVLVFPLRMRLFSFSRKNLTGGVVGSRVFFPTARSTSRP